ncbi:MAG: hypothetical protein ACFFD4_17745 [Candidatus Odinarchaeota archaeon]
MLSLDNRLEEFVNETVKKDNSIYNAVLAISIGKSSFEWSGAAGIAVREGQIEMKPDTFFHSKHY